MFCSVNIEGIQFLYQKQKYLPIITKEDKQEMNQLLARILLSSYCYVNNDSIRNGYVGLVGFIRMEFEDVKDSLVGYAHFHLLNNQEDLSYQLEIAEKKLSEEEKFLFGYLLLF